MNRFRAVVMNRFRVVVLSTFGLICVISLILPAIQQHREPGVRPSCKNTLKQIALALHNYHDEYDSFPPAVITDASGKPMHSWRALLLPFVDQRPLYEKYDFDEPWDGPNNRKLWDEMPDVFSCPERSLSRPNRDGNRRLTDYVAVLAPNGDFPPPPDWSDESTVAEGTQILLLVELTDSDINWLEPRDLPHEAADDVAQGGVHEQDAGWFSTVHGVYAAMVDGSVRLIESSEGR